MSKKPADVDIDELFSGIDDSSSAPPPTTGSKPTAAAEDEHDPLAELESLAERPKPASRPLTPLAATSAAKKSLERSRTPASAGYGLPSSRPGTADLKKTAEKTPVPTESSSAQEQESAAASASSGGWGWGSLWSTATTVVKSAEGVVKEIQQSDEGKKWVSQVKGNADLLRGLAGDVRAKALPGLTNLLHTLAPPISSHEQLRIHITHDLQNYPFIDAVVYGVFDRVMQQVEGGDLLVVQRGSASRPRSESGGGVFSGGPWWKAMEKRELNATHGLQEGVKLAKAAAESYAQEFQSKTSPVAETSNENPTSKSNIFLAIQPTIVPQSALSIVASEEKKQEEVADEQVVAFAIQLFDPIHELSFSALSQALPLQWLEWLDAPPPKESRPGEWLLPEVIQDIVDAGGVDPREWVVEWVEETVGLAVGIVAQRYVAKRMRVGEAGEVSRIVREHAGVGEEARAVGM